MTDLQSRILLLMNEINDICEKQKLKYVVSGLYAAYVTAKKSFEDELCFFNIMMPFKDAVKLEKYVNKNMSDTRAVESWSNNSELQSLKFRYVDKTTLLFDGGSSEKHKFNGVCINIMPTREFEPSDEVRGIERYVQLMNFHQEEYAFKLITSKLITRVTHLRRFKAHYMCKIKLDNANYIHYGYLKRNKMTKEEMVKYVIDANLKATKPYTTLRYIPEDKLTEDTKPEKCLAYADEKSNVIKLPADLYTNIEKVDFENTKLNVYKEKDKYLEALYGLDWAAKLEDDLPTSDRSTFIYDLEIPYSEYLEYTKDDKVTLDEITDNKLKYNYWMGQVHNPAVNKTWHTFMMARRSVERIDLWYKLRSKREALKEAYEKEDLAKLKKLMNPYLKATEKYLREKIGFYIDDELFKYAAYIWKNEGKPDRKDAEGNLVSYDKYVYSFVPELYRTETPDQYFAKRGKTFD